MEHLPPKQEPIPTEQIINSKRANMATTAGLSVVFNSGNRGEILAQNESGKSGRVITNAQWKGSENNPNKVKNCNSTAYLSDSDGNTFSLVDCVVIYGEGGIGQLEGNPDYFIIAADLPSGIVNGRRQKRNTNLLISRWDLRKLINTNNSDLLSVLAGNPELTSYVLSVGRRKWRDIPSSYHNFQTYIPSENQFNSDNKTIQES